MERSYDLTSGSILQHLLRLAAPLIMGNILQQLYNTVEAFILGRFAGDLEFAAVGVAGSVMNLFLFMITGACTGISVIFAQLYGAGEHDADGARRGGDGQCRARLLLCCALSVGHRGRGVGDGGVAGHFGGAVHPLPAAQGTGAHFARADCRMDGELLKQTAHFSFVTALHQSSLYIGKLLVQGAVNTGGTDMISAYTATTRIEGFANSFGDSGSAATSVLVAQNRGAGKEERVKESFRSSLFLMLAMGLAMSLIMYVSASTSVGFMLGTRSGAAFENARDYLKLVALFYTLCFTGSTFAGYFNDIGKVSVPFLGATSHIALRVVLSWLLVGKMGLPAVALATGLGWVLVNALWTVIKWGMERKVKMQTVKKSK